MESIKDNKSQDNKVIRYARITGILLGVILILGVSYAIFTITKSSDKGNALKVGALSLILDDSTSNGITLQNAYPQAVGAAFSDENNFYTFSLKNNGDYNVNYEIKMQDTSIKGDMCNIPQSDGKDPIQQECKRLESDYLFYALKDITNSDFTFDNFSYQNGEGLYTNILRQVEENSSNELKTYLLATGSINKGETKKFKMLLMMPRVKTILYSDNPIIYSDVVGKEFSAKLMVVATQKPVSSSTGNLSYTANIISNPINSSDKIMATLTNDGVLTLEGTESKDFISKGITKDYGDDYDQTLVYDLLKNAGYSDPMIFLYQKTTGSGLEDWGQFQMSEVLTNLNDWKANDPDDYNGIMGTTKTPEEWYTALVAMKKTVPVIKTVIVGKNIKRLGNLMFWSSSVENVIFRGENIEIGSSTFKSSNLKTISLDNNVVTLDNNAFSDCKFLTSITITGTKTLGTGVFDNLCGNANDVVHLGTDTNVTLADFNFNNSECK